MTLGTDRGCRCLPNRGVGPLRVAPLHRLFFIEPSTRKVETGGISRTANGLWMSQIARNLTYADEGIVSGKGYLIHDRDPLFTTEFVKVLADFGVKTLKLPP